MMFFNLAKILPINLGNHFQRTNIQIVHFGSKSIKTLRTKIWDLIPTEIKALKISYDFQEKDKELCSKELPLLPLQDLYSPSFKN